MAIVINGSGTIAGITAGGLEEYVVNATVDTMTGDNSDVTLALSVAPGSENNVQITFDGVTQHHSTFSLSGSTITFSTAPATGVAVEAITGGSSTTGTPDNNTVNLAQLASGTDGELFTWDTSGDPAKVAVGTATHVLTSGGAGVAPTFQAAAGSTVATEQSTASGTTFTFSSIPAGTSLIVISFQSLSLDDTDHFHIQIGDAGGIETSGYVSESCQSIGGGAITVTSTTAGFIIRGGNGIPSGVATLALLDDDAFTWTFGASYRLNTTTCAFSGGHKSLSAELTQLKFLTPGSGNYDGGSLNIQYF